MEIPATGYQSQEEAIRQKAEEQGIPFAQLDACFDKTIQELRELPGADSRWELQRAEKLVWDHFFPNDPFPGRMSRDRRSRTRDKPSMADDWVHDLFNVSPHKESRLTTTNEMRAGDIYNGAAGGWVGSTDRYVPPPRKSESRREDKREVNDTPKPTIYASQADYMLRKAVEFGYTHYQYEDIAAEYNGEVVRKYANGTRSFHWLQWKQEEKIWRHLFMKDPFPGIEPEATIRVPRQGSSSRQESSALKENKPPRQEASSRQRSPAPKERSGVISGPAEDPRLRAHSSSSAQHQTTKASVRPSFTVGHAANIPKRPYVSQERSIYSKARKLSMPDYVVQCVFDEKRPSVRNRFASHGKDWQQYFLEASVWGRLFPHDPFPGREPSREISSCSPEPPVSEDNPTERYRTFLESKTVPEYIYKTQERLMEHKAIQQGGSELRTKFFRFLSGQRLAAIERSPGCTCYAKAWWADTTTWKKIFPGEIFPVKGPTSVHAPTCSYVPQLVPAGSYSNIGNKAAAPTNAPNAPKVLPSVQAPPKPQSIQTTQTRTLSSNTPTVPSLEAPSPQTAPQSNMGAAASTAISNPPVEKIGLWFTNVHSSGEVRKTLRRDNSHVVKVEACGDLQWIAYFRTLAVRDTVYERLPAYLRKSTAQSESLNMPYVEIWRPEGHAPMAMQPATNGTTTAKPDVEAVGLFITNLPSLDAVQQYAKDANVKLSLVTKIANSQWVARFKTVAERDAVFHRLPKVMKSRMNNIRPPVEIWTPNSSAPVTGDLARSNDASKDTPSALESTVVEIGSSMTGHKLAAPSSMFPTQPITSQHSQGYFSSLPAAFLENSPPPSVLVALAEARNSRQLPPGSLLMRNMEPTVCSSDFVTRMFAAVQSENVQSIEPINTGLKCYFRYHRRMDGDLLLWVEPFVQGDLSAHNCGHAFLRGWTQRNMGFGIVKPSFYWNEIQNTAIFKQVPTAPNLPTATTSTETASPAKSDNERAEPRLGTLTKSENETLDTRAVNRDSPSKSSSQKDGAAIILKGSFTVEIPCSPAGLKNLAFSFLGDGNDEVEQKLRCTISVRQPKGNDNQESQSLHLVVERHVGTEKSDFDKATRFAQAWARQAIQPTPYTLSKFLSSPRGILIVGRQPPALPVQNAFLKSSGGPDMCALDRMINEEKAKAENSSRLVLDEMTGEVIALRELLHRYRASPKVQDSSVMSVVEEEDSDDYVEVTGTDGQMKHLEGQFVVVANSMDYEPSRAIESSKPEATGVSENAPAAVPLEVSSEVIETSELVDGEREAVEAVEDAVEGAVEGLLPDFAETYPIEFPTAALENGSGVVETSEPVDEVLKEVEDLLQVLAETPALDRPPPLENVSVVSKASASVTVNDMAYRDPSPFASSEDGSEATTPSAPVNGKRKVDNGDDVEEHAEKKVCI